MLKLMNRHSKELHLWVTSGKTRTSHPIDKKQLNG